MISISFTITAKYKPIIRVPQVIIQKAKHITRVNRFTPKEGYKSEKKVRTRC